MYRGQDNQKKFPARRERHTVAVCLEFNEAKGRRAATLAFLKWLERALPDNAPFYVVSVDGLRDCLDAEVTLTRTVRRGYKEPVQRFETRKRGRQMPSLPTAEFGAGSRS